MKFVDQTTFGRSKGNCDAACLASLLGLGIEDVPAFYTTDETTAEQNLKRFAWLNARGWQAVYITWTAERGTLNSAYLVPDTIVHVTGKSPRGDWNHGVLGVVTAGGWRLLHDPHPSRAGIVGDPLGVEYVFPLMRRKPYSAPRLRSLDRVPGARVMKFFNRRILLKESTMAVAVSESTRVLAEHVDRLITLARDEALHQKLSRQAQLEAAHTAKLRAQAELDLRGVIARAGVPVGCSFSRGGFQFRVGDGHCVAYQREAEPLEHVLADVFGAPDLGAEA